MDNKINIEDWGKLVTHPRLGEILLQRKKIIISQLEICLKEQLSANIPLGEILVKYNFISKNDLIELLELQTEIDNILAESIKEIKSSAK